LQRYEYRLKFYNREQLDLPAVKV